MTVWLPPWDASYAANTGHHRVYDELYLATTPLSPADRVLDLGCGSGDFTRIVADRVPDGEVVGLDPQPALLAEARACAGPNQSFVEAPVQHLAVALAGSRALRPGHEPGRHAVGADGRPSRLPGRGASRC